MGLNYNVKHTLLRNEGAGGIFAVVILTFISHTFSSVCLVHAPFSYSAYP